MNSGVYAILNLINDKFYIGSSKDFYKRWHSHKSMLKGDYHDNSYLQRSWNKYGQLNLIFIIIEHCDIEKLTEREQFYLDTLNPEYNLKPTANNMTGFKHSEISNEKNRQAHLGKTASLETKKLLSERSTNRDRDKWPHEKGSRCDCKECKVKWRVRDKQHMREWRNENRDAYNAYMREYGKAYRLKRKLIKAIKLQ